MPFLGVDENYEFYSPTRNRLRRIESQSDPITNATSHYRARRENRSTNGSGTVTFRRSSNAPHTLSAQADNLPAQSLEVSEDLPHQQTQSYEPSVPADLRYPKPHLLDLYQKHREAKDSGARNGDVSRLYVEGWNPGQSIGTNGRAWGKVTDGRETHGPDACWDMTGSQRPVSLEEMTEDEKIVSLPTNQLAAVI